MAGGLTPGPLSEQTDIFHNLRRRRRRSRLRRFPFTGFILPRSGICRHEMGGPAAAKGQISFLGMQSDFIRHVFVRATWSLMSVVVSSCTVTVSGT